MNNRSISFVLITAMCVLSVGCHGQQAVSSDNNAENKYYSSESYTFNDPGYVFDKVIDLNGRKVALFYGITDENKNDKIAYILDDNARWDKRVKINDQGEVLGSVCPLDDNRVVATTYYGFNIYDIDSGALLYRNDDMYMILDEALPEAYRSEEGFVIVSRDSIYKLSSDGSLIDQMTYDEAGSPSHENAYYCDGGKEYLILYDDLIRYYEIDLDQKNVTYICSNEDLGLGLGDTYRATQYVMDDYSGTVLRLDLDNKTTRKCSYRKDMLIKPMMYYSGYAPRWFFFDDNYAVCYEYPGGYTVINLISPDDSLNIAERTKLCVKGYDAGRDYALNYAAYLYNTSQDSYFLTIDNYEIEEYGYSTALEAQEAKLKLLTEFSNGNAPDIFFGNDFDYDQMGRDGLVIDMKPYLNNSTVINGKNITPNIYELFFSDQHCYKVFAGYSMFGLWSTDKLVKSNDLSVDDLKEINGNKRIFGDVYASDLADFMIRYPIKQLIDGDDFISENKLSEMISFAIDNGKGPNDVIAHVADAYSVSTGEHSVFLDYVGNINIFMDEQSCIDDRIKFVGFPSVNGSVHVAHPFGIVAVSSGTKHPEECIRFIEMMFSDEVQRAVLAHNSIPVKDALYNEVLQATANPSDFSDSDYYKMLFGDDKPETHLSTDDMIESYREATGSLDTLMINDWGLYNIVAEEINSYYLQNRDIKDIAHSMRSRIQLYIQENYV